MRTQRPLVSCIMPTRDRRQFVPQAIRYFLRQTYEPSELIIVDDSAQNVGDLVPQDERIRYVRASRRRPLGAKRNRACREARGDIIVHWDDDDWMAEWRLAYQVDALLRSRAHICGTDRLYFYDPHGQRAWQYRYPGGRPWVAGGTLCYRRAYWQTHPFPEINIGEDTRFVWRSRASDVLALDDTTFYVALIHGANTSSRPLRSKRWEPRRVDEVQRLLGADLPFYTTPPTAAPALAARSPRETPGRAHVHTPAPQPRVTVSVPYYRSAAFIRRAVQSILAQTHHNLRVIVVNDGDAEPPWPLLDDIADPRLVRFDLDANRGRYFADAVVLEATSDAYFLVQDADDWSEPARLATLLRAMRANHAVAALSALQQFRATRHAVQPLARITHDARRRTLSPRFLHRGHHTGLFTTAALRAVGGYYAGFRVGYDSLLVNLLMMTGPVAFVDEPLYNRLVHAASLTGAPATGLRSAFRLQVARQLDALYRAAWADYTRYLDGAIDVAELSGRFRTLLDAGVPAPERQALAASSARLRALLVAQDAVLAVPRAAAS